MCGTCEVLIKENFKTIRKASLKYTSKFVETNDLINTVVLKFLNWKKNKQDANQPFVINIKFFYTITKNAAIDARTLNTVNFEDEVEAYETNAINNSVIHQNLIAKTKFSDPQKHAIIIKLLELLNERERDAILSVATSMRSSVCLKLRPLSITIFNPDSLGFVVLSGRKGSSTFIIIRV